MPEASDASRPVLVSKHQEVFRDAEKSGRMERLMPWRLRPPATASGKAATSKANKKD